MAEAPLQSTSMLQAHVPYLRPSIMQTQTTSSSRDRGIMPFRPSSARITSKSSENICSSAMQRSHRSIYRVKSMPGVESGTIKGESDVFFMLAIFSSSQVDFRRAWIQEEEEIRSLALFSLLQLSCHELYLCELVLAEAGRSKGRRVVLVDWALGAAVPPGLERRRCLGPEQEDRSHWDGEQNIRQDSEEK